MIEKIILISVFTLIIHTSDTLSYAVRLAGIKTGKLAVALSLTSIIVIVTRTSNLVQGPLTASLIDHAKITGNLQAVESQFRIVIGSASLGTLLAILLLPSFVLLFSRMVTHLEVAGSVPKMIRNVSTIQSLSNARGHLRLPKWEMLSRLRIGGIPKRLMLMNILVTAVYTVGVLSSLYASLLMPEYSSVAVMSSGLINGVATIIFSVLIDPQVALLTDEVMQGTKEQANMYKIVGWLMISRLIGTILAQALLIPAAYWVLWLIPLWT